MVWFVGSLDTWGHNLKLLDFLNYADQRWLFDSRKYDQLIWRSCRVVDECQGTNERIPIYLKKLIADHWSCSKVKFDTLPQFISNGLIQFTHTHTVNSRSVQKSGTSISLVRFNKLVVLRFLFGIRRSWRHCTAGKREL